MQGVVTATQFRILFYSLLMSRNLNIKIYKTVILVTFLHGCETSPLNPRKGRRLKMFKDMVLRKILELQTEREKKYQEEGKNYMQENFISCNFHQILLG